MKELNRYIDNIKKGDPIAFKYFFETFYPKLMALACRFVEEDIAKDLVQEVFTNYWENKNELAPENIHSFLFKCLQNGCLNYLKHQIVASEYEARIRIAESRINFLNENSDANEVLKQVLDKELREIIELSVNKLPPKCAQAFRLHYFHDVSRKEVADIMGISVRTVEGHIHQALLFLRKDLKDFLFLIFML